MRKYFCRPNGNGIYGPISAEPKPKLYRWIESTTLNVVYESDSCNLSDKQIDKIAQQRRAKQVLAQI